MASSTVAAAYTPSQLQSQQTNDGSRELDAARALLGVSPSIISHLPVPLKSKSSSSSSGDSRFTSAAGDGQLPQIVEEPPVFSSSALQPDAVRPALDFGALSRRRPRSNSEALDALAMLASKEERVACQNTPESPPAPSVTATSSSSSSSSDDDSEAMPPPPPRLGRRRSVSNPEGMEKWDSYSSQNQHRFSNTMRSSRVNFVLPACILEEELAEASAAVREQEEQRKPGHQSDDSSTRITVVIASNDGTSSEEASAVEEHDESNMTPEELLQRARSRLLEDLSEGNLNGEKGMLTLPHSLSKYKEVYNKNGRIGIYTPTERSAIIARFNRKRARRVWKKKIRYNCRKSLADRRLRIKGRFVKRSEQMQLAKQQEEILQKGGEAEEAHSGVGERESASAENSDEGMPDVNDPEAGFSPTEDQPYRRLRRHTIT